LAGVRNPGIDLLAAPPSASELVLLAHGGQIESLRDPHDWRVAILRMWPFAVAARDAVPGAAIGLMRYRYRGWNGQAAHPAADLRDVLGCLPDRIERVVLIGHSMGGRAVVASGNHPKVLGVLALAPWLPQGEPLTMQGDSAEARRFGSAESARTVVLAHGTEDRVTDPRLTASYARQLRETGVPVGLLSAEGERHAMLHRYADWNELVRRFTRHTIRRQAADVAAGSCAVLSTEPDRVDLLPRWNRPAGVSAGVRDIAAARLRLRVRGQLLS
jgi:dienelactone hydrolase